MFYLINATFLMANISSIEQKFAYALISSRQDTTHEDTITRIPEIFDRTIEAISPQKALMYSAVLPGLGQAYVNNWQLNKRVFLFATIEVLSIWTWSANDRLGKKYRSNYESYADDNWSFSRWLHDYYIWDSAPDSLRQIFINIETDIYHDIWSGSHSINFTCNSNACQKPYYRTSSNQFEPLFTTFCGGINSVEGTCNNSIEIIDQMLEEYKVEIEKDHHYYENIGKYDPFFAGWNDNDSLYLLVKSNGELLAMSPHKREYRKDWDKANEKYFKVATYALSSLLANHAISMLEALISTKLFNLRNKIDLSAYPYFNPENQLGIGGVSISIKL